VGIVYLGLGSNLGDRRGNIVQALQKIRARCGVEAVSSFYEIPPMEGVAGPHFLNIAVKISTDLGQEELERFLRGVEVAVGRNRTYGFAARSIDIDMLYSDVAVHPRIAQRPFNVIPLAEIAPNLRDPITGLTVRAMLENFDIGTVVKKQPTPYFTANRQEGEPEIKLAINRVGVSRVKRIVHLTLDGRDTIFNGEFSMVADLSPDKAGVHMSRFSELLEEAALDVLARTDPPGRIEELVARIAREIIVSQQALCAEVRLRAEFGLERWTPVSGKRGEETYTLVGIARADTQAVRRVLGVEAEGMTACPCAQLMVREHSLRELTEAGFSQEDANRALDALPLATHNQRGRGAIFIGATEDRFAEIRVEDLVEIVESSMSSETYDLLKRPDEFFVVNKAHHNPKFVEDVVRGMMAQTLAAYADFSDDTFVAASQVNYESIHKHDVFAETFGTFGELREELRGGKHISQKTDMAAWLGERLGRRPY
jgi:GTP cyclohydrolase IV